ncbi:Nif3-like dinuclear metal center hexameric protein [Thiobacter aerophilum]|uniref:Nif3-like dinuclear metal center hexameric protein n=1 Tax=Thiobacter aerophilum TaxID=3121275 RepID=A0ABV0EFK1_9BURK
MRLEDLDHYTRALLDVSRFRDYCPNGLQVEGRAEVLRIVTGVSASLALLEAAIAAGADAVLVHHGYFWKNEPAPIVGVKRARIGLLLAHEVSLFAFHLPLDAHPELGNNARLGRRLGLTVEEWTGEQGLIALGRLSAPCLLGEFAARVEHALGRTPLVVGERDRPLKRIAWCSGGAQGYFETVAALGVDAYLTGEASEHNVHFARESGVAFIAAGHHATERDGIQALGDHLAAQFGLEHRFIDIPNPV